MKLLEIKKYPDPILSKKAKEISVFDKELEELILDMTVTMKEKDGVGLAAPQIGKSIQLIIVKTGKGPKAFINPRIVKKSRQKETLEEGCLSFPGIRLSICRPRDIGVVALDENGKEVKIEVSGFVARIFQHEIDHLNGVYFVSRASFFKRLKAKKALRQLEKEWRKQ